MASKQPPVPKCLINKRIRGLHVSAYCDQWQYGTWQNKKACLLVLDFQFIPGFHLERAEIELFFDPFVPGETAAIEAFGPAQLEGSKTTNTLSQNQTFTSSLSGGAAGVSLGLGLSGEHDSSYDKIWHGFIEGDSSVKPDSDSKHKNHIIWYLREDPLQSLGVPSRFRPAVIVSHERGFMLDCVIRLDNGVFGKHWWKIARNMTLLANRTLRSEDKNSWVEFGDDDDKREIPILHEPAPNGPPIGRDLQQFTENQAVPAKYTPRFDQITLDQWQRIWKCRWSEDTPKLDQNTTIYDYLHNTAKVPIPAAALSAPAPAPTPPTSTGSTKSEQPPPDLPNISVDNFVRHSTTSTQPLPVLLPNIVISNALPPAKRRLF